MFEHSFLGTKTCHVWITSLPHQWQAPLAPSLSPSHVDPCRSSTRPGTSSVNPWNKSRSWPRIRESWRGHKKPSDPWGLKDIRDKHQLSDDEKCWKQVNLKIWKKHNGEDLKDLEDLVKWWNSVVKSEDLDASKCGIGSWRVISFIGISLAITSPLSCHDEKPAC